MSVNLRTPDRYQTLRRTGRALSGLAPLVTLAIWALGASAFLDQSKDLISDAQFTWGERRILAINAVVIIGGSLLAGLLVGRLLRAASDMIDLAADLSDSARRNNELIERHVIPLLGRIAANSEHRASSSSGQPSSRHNRTSTFDDRTPNDSADLP